MKVPACALNRRSSTVLVRIMDVCDHCNRRGVRALLSDESEEPRVSFCEFCSKVASLGQDYVPDTRNVRRGANRRKKARFFTASWLLLLVGGFAPVSTAPILAKPSSISFEAGRAVNHALEYADELVKAFIRNDATMEWKFVLTTFTKSYSNLEHLSWFQKEMLPACKEFSTNASEDCLNSVMKDMDETKLKHLQKQLYKALSYVVASFESMAEGKRQEADIPVVKKMMTTVEELKYVRNRTNDTLRLLDIYDSSLDAINEAELPTRKDLVDIKGSTPNWKEVAAVYRETLNFVQYFAQVYDKIAKICDDMIL